MTLFSDTLAQSNLLPKDGCAIYLPEILNSEACHRYFALLFHEIPWQNDMVKLFGKTITTKRKTAWFGDREFNYTYSGVGRVALAWTKPLVELKNITEKISGFRFNSCLLNLYHNGLEGMSWHSDDEKPLGSNPVIAALSLGSARAIRFRHKAKLFDPVSRELAPGSLLVMKGETQIAWQHSIPVTKKVSQPRISLTFRTIH